MTDVFKNLWATAIAGTAGLIVVGLLGCGGGSDQSTTSTTAAAPPTPPSAQGTDWPTYGLDPARTRYLPTEVVKPPFKVSWRYNAGRLMEYSPIIVRHTLY